MFAKPNDYDRCRIIVQRNLGMKKVVVDENKINSIVQEILEIVYAKGGDYSSETLEAYVEVHIDDNF